MSVAEYKKRRQTRLDAKAVYDYRERREQRWIARMDAEIEEEENNGGGSHGNTKIPFGLCQREGIKVEPGWGPKEAWDALAGKGYSAADVYKELRETGKVAPRKEPPMDKKAATSYIREYKANAKRLKEYDKEIDAAWDGTRLQRREKRIQAERVKTISEEIEKHEAQYGKEHHKLTDQQKQERDDLYATLKDANEKWNAADAKEKEYDKKYEDLRLEKHEFEEKHKAAIQKYHKAVLVKYPSFDDCKSMAAIKERYDALELFDPRTPPGFGTLDKDAARSLAKTAESFFDKVPSIKGKLGATIVSRMSERTYGQSENHQVRLNSHWYGDPAVFEEHYAGDVRKKFHPAGTKAEAVLFHEYTHQIEDYWGRHFGGGSRNPPQLSTRILDEVSKKFGMNRDSVKNEVSTYAWSKKYAGHPEMDDMEFLAEAYSEYLASEAPRRVAREVGSIMERYLKDMEEKK